VCFKAAYNTSGRKEGDSKMDILKKRENKEDDPNETNFLPVYIYNKEIRGG